jgi:hypothetical protein
MCCSGGRRGLHADDVCLAGPPLLLSCSLKCAPLTPVLGLVCLVGPGWTWVEFLPRLQHTQAVGGAVPHQAPCTFWWSLKRWEGIRGTALSGEWDQAVSQLLMPKTQPDLICDHIISIWSNCKEAKFDSDSLCGLSFFSYWHTNTILFSLEAKFLVLFMPLCFQQYIQTRV